jgi:hypothetical protein
VAAALVHDGPLTSKLSGSRPQARLYAQDLSFWADISRIRGVVSVPFNNSIFTVTPRRTSDTCRDIADGGSLLSSVGLRPETLRPRHRRARR